MRCVRIVAAATLIGALGAGWAAVGVAADPKIRIAFVGDSTADGLWGGFSSLAAHNSCLKSMFEPGRYAKNSTGLTRPDKYNWPEEVRKLGESLKPHLFMVSLGLNDRQSVIDYPEGGGRRITQYDAPDWADRYRERVTAMLKGATTTDASVLWVGLAAMRENAANLDAQRKNTIFAQAVTEFAVPRVQYVPPWRLSETGVDVFTSYAPDRTGRMIHIRAADGEHFTPAGDEMVATYLFPKIVATLRNSGIELDGSCAIVAQ
jgi:uncharacterized protein